MLIRSILASVSAALLGISCPHATLLAQPTTNFGGLGGGGPITSHVGDCIAPHARHMIEHRIERNTRSLTFDPAGSRGTGPFMFWPQAGTLFAEIGCNTFVDLDPGPAFSDYLCSPLTYDGHRGIDADLRSFGEQVIGVPVYSVLPGIVIDRADGHFDMHTFWTGEAGNYVILQHAGGIETWYFHLKNGSVLPQLGQVVRAGEQLGQTASSGNSGGPHLHFETRINGQTYEPFAGACRPGASGFAIQPTRPSDTYLSDMGFTFTDLATVPGWPFASPRTGQLALSDDRHWIWTNINYLPAMSTFRFRWIRPDGALSWESPIYPFNNPDFYGRAWYWFNWWIDEMHTITGTWRVQMEINGRQLFDAPIEVRPARTPEFNRPPAPVQVIFDPPAPTPDGVVFCRVQTSLLYDDPDYDIVRYRYVWRVNGAAVRIITSAGLGDAIPTGTFAAGDLLSCEVTPNDGLVDGPLASISFDVPGDCDADFNHDGSANSQDFFDFLGAFFGQLPEADFNHDGATNSQDFFDFLAAFFAGC